MSTRESFPGGEADHSPPSSAKVKECVELYFHSPDTTSGCGAQLKKHRDNFTFTFNFTLIPEQNSGEILFVWVL